MRNRAMAACVIASLMALAACDDTMMVDGTGGAAAPATVASGDAVARLRSLGFRPAATAADGAVAALRYSGPVTAAVVCRAGPAGFAPIRAAMTDLDGIPKRATLDAYVILSGGRVANGIYALTLRAGPGRVEGIDFNIGQSKAFASGLVCKAA